MNDPEVAAFEKISQALGAVEDPEARGRVLIWANAKFAPNVELKPKPLVAVARASTPAEGQANDGASCAIDELRGVVEYSEDGTLRVIARDLKAKSRNDAAIRLAHITVYAHQKITGEQKTSSKKVLLPVLREWRAYDPNTRVALAHQPGIKRDGDWLSLDVHSRRDAETYIRQIVDDSVQGAWRPVNQSGKKRAKPKGDKTAK
jgi:hypothetical protein